MVIKPYVGLKGNYIFLTPFDVNNKNIIYTCMSVRNIIEVVADGRNVLDNIYKANNLTEADYNNDIKNEELIVVLKSELGNWLTVPNKYIDGLPDINGVKYHILGLSVNLGALSVDKNVNPLIESISNEVVNYLGITPEIKEVVCSKPVLVAKDESVILENARETIISKRYSDKNKISQLNSEISKLLFIKSQLEEYIVNNSNWKKN